MNYSRRASVGYIACLKFTFLLAFTYFAWDFFFLLYTIMRVLHHILTLFSDAYVIVNVILVIINKESTITDCTVTKMYIQTTYPLLFFSVLYLTTLPVFFIRTHTHTHAPFPYVWLNSTRLLTTDNTKINTRKRARMMRGWT